MGSRRESLGRGFAARRAARAERARRSMAQAVANQPSASVLGPEFRDETETERELKELEAERRDRDAELAQLIAEKEDSGEADRLREEIERIEAEIARERRQRKE